MMVISLPKDILALNLCTENNLSIFCVKTVRSVTLFFRDENWKSIFTKLAY